MSLSDNAKPGRRAVLAGMGAAASTAVLAACGFSPAYGPNGIGTRLRNQIVADAPDSRTEYAFVAQLEDRLGRNLSAPYALRYALTTSEDGVAITADQVTQRYHIAGQLTYSVVEQASQTVLTRACIFYTELTTQNKFGLLIEYYFGLQPNKMFVVMNG